VTEKEAYNRAIRACWEAYAQSNNFEGGSLSSDECLAIITKALAKEFKQEKSKPKV